MNSVAGTNASIAINKASQAAFFRLTYGNLGKYILTNMLPNWDGHYQLDNANIPSNTAVTNISDATYTWAILIGSNAFTMVADNENSGNSDNGAYSTANNKSRSEMYVPLHVYTNGQLNLAGTHISYVIPQLTGYGTNNNPYWIMQIYGPSGRPMCFVGLHPAYGGQAGIPYLGVYTNMQFSGVTAGEIEYAFKLVGSPFTAIGDIRSNGGFTLWGNFDFSTNAVASATVQIIPAASTATVFQASCPLAMQSVTNHFSDGQEIFLKFGSYNGGGLHHHAKVVVNYFDVWSSAPLPALPVLGPGTYYIPALQHRISAGNYNNLGIN